MRHKTYQIPLVEIIEVESDTLMEQWSIGIDNDPNHAIGPGNENDIGAKPGLSFNEEDGWGESGFNLWED